MNKEKLIKIGRCGKAHGIKGAFHFVLENKEDSVLKKGSRIFIGKDANGKLEEKEITEINFGNKVIVKLVGINTRNQVEELVPFNIYFKRKDFPELSEGEFFLNDLLNFEVIIKETSVKIGKVEGFYDNGVQDILFIKGNQKEIDIPLIDRFVDSIDFDEKKIYILDFQLF